MAFASDNYSSILALIKAKDIAGIGGELFEDNYSLDAMTVEHFQDLVEVAVKSKDEAAQGILKEWVTSNAQLQGKLQAVTATLPGGEIGEFIKSALPAQPQQPDSPRRRGREKVSQESSKTLTSEQALAAINQYVVSLASKKAKAQKFLSNHQDTLPSLNLGKLNAVQLRGALAKEMESLSQRIQGQLVATFNKLDDLDEKRRFISNVRSTIMAANQQLKENITKAESGVDDPHPASSEGSRYYKVQEKHFREGGGDDSADILQEAINSFDSWIDNDDENLKDKSERDKLRQLATGKDNFIKMLDALGAYHDGPPSDKGDKEKLKGKLVQIQQLAKQAEENASKPKAPTVPLAPPFPPDINVANVQPSRGALLGDIRKGTQLKKVAPRTDNVQPSRDALLGDIRKGIQLKKVAPQADPNQQPKAPKAPPMFPKEFFEGVVANAKAKASASTPDKRGIEAIQAVMKLDAHVALSAKPSKEPTEEQLKKYLIAIINLSETKPNELYKQAEKISKIKTTRLDDLKNLAHEAHENFSEVTNKQEYANLFKPESSGLDHSDDTEDDADLEASLESEGGESDPQSQSSQLTALGAQQRGLSDTGNSLSPPSVPHTALRFRAKKSEEAELVADQPSPSTTLKSRTTAAATDEDDLSLGALKEKLEAASEQHGAGWQISEPKGNKLEVTSEDGKPLGTIQKNGEDVEYALNKVGENDAKVILEVSEHLEVGSTSMEDIDKLTAAAANFKPPKSLVLDEETKAFVQSKRDEPAFREMVAKIEANVGKINQAHPELEASKQTNRI